MDQIFKTFLGSEQKTEAGEPFIHKQNETIKISILNRLSEVQIDNYYLISWPHVNFLPHTRLRDKTSHV